MAFKRSTWLIVVKIPRRRRRGISRRWGNSKRIRDYNFGVTKKGLSINICVLSSDRIIRVKYLNNTVWNSIINRKLRYFVPGFMCSYFDNNVSWPCERHGICCNASSGPKQDHYHSKLETKCHKSHRMLLNCCPSSYFFPGMPQLSQSCQAVRSPNSRWVAGLPQISHFGPGVGGAGFLRARSSMIWRSRELRIRSKVSMSVAVQSMIVWFVLGFGIRFLLFLSGIRSEEEQDRKEYQGGH